MAKKDSQAETVSQAEVVQRLRDFVKPESNIELLLNALLKFYLGEEDNEWCLTHSNYPMSKFCSDLSYQLNVVRPNTVLD